MSPTRAADGRKNFLKAIARVPAVRALGDASKTRGPVKGGPVRVGFIGVGVQGRALLSRIDPDFVEVAAMADIRPDSLAAADAILRKARRPPATHYVEYTDLLERENIEAIISAPPLWMHADIATACLDAGKHVLCEKMIAKSREGWQRMIEAARRNDRVLEIGYHRNYSPVFRSAYEGVIRTGTLGDVYHVRLVWTRNGNWRRTDGPPSEDYNPSKWGYPTWDHLNNWRLYWKYSEGLFSELGSHEVNSANWFLGSRPRRVQAMGGIDRFRDGREVPDHVYATFEYPGGITGTFSSIESNAFDEQYDAFYGTKGTLIIRNETEPLLFYERGTSGTKPRQPRRSLTAKGRQSSARVQTISPSTYEINGWVSAIRTGSPLRCGPEAASASASWTIAANEAMRTGRTVDIP
jgi:predicted dehydrogenase